TCHRLAVATSAGVRGEAVWSVPAAGAWRGDGRDPKAVPSSSPWHESSPYGNKREKWPRLRIADVRVGDRPDGRAIHPHIHHAAHDQANLNYELQIHLRNGEIVRILDNYGDAELQWMATVLRRSLRVPEESSTSSTDLEG